mmetsp:Transcript_26300/g.86418  ORF Transcript_26300/g.86418 Transcript_26300/m.86418 type:complete len:406 (+) Transcript_26300:95-1312(+)
MFVDIAMQNAAEMVAGSTTFAMSSLSRRRKVRNGACIPCRHVKLKCDEEKPCRRCIRHWGYLLAHSVCVSWREDLRSLDADAPDGVTVGEQADVASEGRARQIQMGGRVEEKAGGPSEVAPAKRHQVSRACEPCRRKKLKCEDTRPCSRCVRKGTMCSGPMLSADVIEDDNQKVKGGHVKGEAFAIGENKFLPFNESHLNRRRVQVAQACVPCKRSKVKCDDVRPCSRCVKEGPVMIRACSQGLGSLEGFQAHVVSARPVGRRVPSSCERCRRSKLKCDMERPCRNCVSHGDSIKCIDSSLAIINGDTNQVVQDPQKPPTSFSRLELLLQASEADWSASDEAEKARTQAMEAENARAAVPASSDLTMLEKLVSLTSQLVEGKFDGEGKQAPSNERRISISQICDQ